MNRRGLLDDDESIEPSIEPGAMEADGRAFFDEEEDDDDDKTSVGSDEEKPDLPGPESKINRTFTTINSADTKIISKVTRTGTSATTVGTTTNSSPQVTTHKAILSDKEIERANEVFKICDAFKEGHLNKDQFAHALAMLGYQFDEKKVKELYQRASSDSLTEAAFTDILSKLRMQDDDELNQKVKEAFEDLFAGTCKDPDRQKNSAGDKFILVKDLRLVLTTKGDKLTDEEADELIRECQPQPGEDGDKTDEGMKRIFFDQYRAMLLDSGM